MAGAAAALAIGVHAPGAAAADDLIVIPVSGIIRGVEGDVITVGSVDVPADLVGATCDVRGQTVNQISVHDGNDLLITTGGQTFEIPNFEDAGFITHEAGVTEALGATIVLQVRLGPDGASSGGFRVSIDCQPEPETTTTLPTTTVPDTTSGPPTTELTGSTEVEATEPPTTPPTTAPSETEPPAEPSVTEAPPVATSTTAAPTTAAPTTETPPAGPTVQGGGPAGLPVTGSNTGLLVGAGAALIGVGLASRRIARAGATSTASGTSQQSPADS